ncbi:MAG: IS256 family transposase [Paracoccaceae bacterium]
MELIEGRLSSPDGRGELVKLATRLIVEEALEAEGRDALEREYYEHGAAPGQGYRNGNRSGRLKTSEGFIDYSAPQIAGRDEPFRSAIRDHLKGRTQALEDLAVELLARGLSVRDIEDAFRDETGRLLLSRTAVSELGERLWADYQEFATRDLSEYDIVYLLVDGIAERLRPGQKREPVLAAWGFTSSGAKVLLHLMAGSKEDAETVSAFFQDMRARGLGDPLLVVSDGAGGIIKALETCFPRSARQRCLAHRMRNLAAKVPEHQWPEFKARVQASYQAPSRAIARELAAGVVADYKSELPSAVACFQDDFEACIAHLRMPVTHRRAIRTTNLLERLFVEERRRLKIIPNAFGEKAVLKLMFSAMIRAAERWRAIRVSDFERHQIKAVREELDQEYKAHTGFAKPKASNPRLDKLSSTSRT